PEAGEGRGICASARGRLAGRAQDDFRLQHQELFDLSEAAGEPAVLLFRVSRRRLRRRHGQDGSGPQDPGMVGALHALPEAAADKDAIFDLATPPGRHAEVLKALPDGAVALIQKPMGNYLGEATEILEICRAKKLKAAVNFQLRFAPMMLALKDAIAKGWLGDVVDFDAWLA